PRERGMAGLPKAVGTALALAILCVAVFALILLGQLPGASRLPWRLPIATVEGARVSALPDPSRLPRIGYLGTLDPDWPAPLEPPRRQLFEERLRELGHVDGQ